MISYEKEIIDFLRIPSIPKREWNRQSAFQKGVAIVNLSLGNLAYAVASFDPEKDREPRITKVFAQEPFSGIDKVFPIPDYMDVDDIEKADLDEESKKHAEELAKEAEEIENEGVEEEVTMPENDWIFPEIHDKDEAEAWLRRYNSQHRIKGKIPTSEETIKLRLYSIYTELQNKTK